MKKIKYFYSTRTMNKRGQLKIQEMALMNCLRARTVNKRGQLKIQEMAFMIIAVVVLFALLGLFVFTIVHANLTKSANENAQAKALAVITRLADSPEFSCLGSRPNCIDSDKLIAMVDRQDYKNFWPFNSLIIIKSTSLNKSEDKMIDCTFANYPDCDRFTVVPKKSNNEKLVSSYVALCRKESIDNIIYDKCEIARVFAGSEVKTISN